jgi:hypothetical protein
MIFQTYIYIYIYRDQVKTNDTGLKAQVLVNGFFIKTFNIEQSVEQGDALSCALFILASLLASKTISKK